ncbi:hypothetical protein DEO72_LG5g2624 [Vigna unguiculata]|uniref:Uncharacterized protein n=1 Tax=Vigna unguiculata TaxID=3917 RepID=A0A4D6M155_VIGUN|nr:hypothetical protein DEO72_LG5g2624 [Vigna unguiculata]
MDNSLDAGEVLGYQSNSNKFRDSKGRHDRYEESLSHFLGDAVFDKNKAGASSKNKDKKADATVQSSLSNSKT